MVSWRNSTAILIPYFAGISRTFIFEFDYWALIASE